MKLFKRRLWEGLTLGFTSLFVFMTGAYTIAMSQSTTINKELNISTSEIIRSDDPQYQHFKSEYGDDYAKLQSDYLALGEEVEASGLVLLKNDNNALPLAEGEKVSTFLTGSVKFNHATSGSSAANTEGYTDLKTALTEAGLEVNTKLWDFYSQQLLLGKGRTKLGSNRPVYQVREPSYESIGQDVTATFPEYGTAIVSIARDSGEGGDINAVQSDTLDGSYLTLSKEELGVLQNLSTLKVNKQIKKIIVLLNSSATIQLDFLEAEGVDVDACLWIGNVGKSGISGVAKALTGEYVPSGKLSDTYLKDNMSSPAMMQQSYNKDSYFMSAYEDSDKLEDKTQKYYGVYSEGIYVGYRYFETRYYDYVTASEERNTGEYDYNADVAYPFGYGLSYTQFEYTNFNVDYDEAAEQYIVTLNVVNKGDTYTGREAVEVYLQKPYTQGRVEKAAVELVGYDKTEALAPGETSETITIKIDKSQLTSYDYEGAETYVLDEGDYYFTVANGSHEAVNNILAAQGNTPENTKGRMDAVGNKDVVASFSLDYDGETYSVSEHTGGEITNRLGFADLNIYEGTDASVTYVSRADWTGTLPKAAITVKATDTLVADLAFNHEIETDPEAAMPAYGRNNGYTITELRGEPYNSQKWEDLLDQMTWEDQSLLITNGKYQSDPLSSVAKPDTTENDGPTGVGGSKGSLSLPSEGIWASTFDDDLIRRVGELLAEDAIAADKDGIYAPACNIHRTPFGGRSHEYFSEDPYLSGKACAVEVQGIQSKGVVAFVKHIAFNDQDDYRSGGAVWLNEQAAREIYLKPFEYSLSSAEGMGNAHAAMSAMNRAGAAWVGASEALLTDIMRGEWGFDGYCVTDMADSDTKIMMSYQDGVPAGTDLFLGQGFTYTLDEYKGNATYAQAMREACHRILYVISNFSVAVNGMTPDTPVGVSSWWWSNTLVAVMCVFGVAAGGSIAMYVVCRLRERKSAAAAK